MCNQGCTHKLLIDNRLASLEGPLALACGLQRVVGTGPWGVHSAAMGRLVDAGAGAPEPMLWRASSPDWA